MIAVRVAESHEEVPGTGHPRCVDQFLGKQSHRDRAEQHEPLVVQPMTP